MRIHSHRKLNIYKYILWCMRKLEIQKGNLTLSDEVIGFFKKKVTNFGTGAKVDCPKEYLGKTVYVVVSKE